MDCFAQKPPVLLIDLSNLVARAIAVGKENYLLLFARMLLKLRKRYPHHRFVFAVEGQGASRRQQILPAYKADRVPSGEVDEARHTSFLLLHHVNCEMIKADAGEADDAIASYVKKYCTDRSVVVLSDDRDLWQLIRSNVVVEARVKNTVTRVDRFACKKLLGVSPEKVPLLKALCGDNSDNIPRGVPRVAERKLVGLAQQAESVGALVAAATEVEGMTESDRRRVEAATTTVAQHLKVTKAWDALPLKTKRGAACADRAAEFLPGMKPEEIATICGKVN